MVSVLVPASGCLLDDGGRTCTLIGSAHGLNLAVSLADAGFDTSVYEVIARADGRTLSVRRDQRPPVTCVAAPDSLEGCTAVVETGDETLLLRAYLTPGDGGEVVLWYGGGALGGPAVVELEVRRNDVTLVTQTYTPQYEVVEPNGPGCGMAAYAFDDLTIVVPPP